MQDDHPLRDDPIIQSIVEDTKRRVTSPAYQTSSPTDSGVTSGPTASTIPAASWPTWLNV